VGTISDPQPGARTAATELKIARGLQDGDHHHRQDHAKMAACNPLILLLFFSIKSATISMYMFDRRRASVVENFTFQECPHPEH
jgi:hypothetical protein